MIGFLFFCIVILIGAVCFVVGRWSAPVPGKLNGVERKELTALRNLTDELYDQSADHIALGDPFASMVFDEIRTHRKKEV